MDSYGSTYGSGGGYGAGSFGSGYSGGLGMGSSSTAGSTTKWWWYVACVILLGGGVFMYLSRNRPDEDTSKKGRDGEEEEDGGPRATRSKRAAETKDAKGSKTNTDATGMRNDLDKERDWASDAPITRLANFAFESKTKPGYVPNKTGAIAPKPAANPPYKFVACEASASYAVRWNGRYLTVKSPNSVKWTEERQEPESCFKTVPGHCGAGNGFVMLRSMANKMFVRADASSGLLVCKDTPTARTADAYCWKLNPDPVPGKQPCGQQYSYDLGRIVDVPCDVQEMPKGAASCSTVTRGYQAACCIRKGPKNHTNHDAFCEATIFPKVVGQQLQQALLYIRTRRPDLTLKPCPEPCATNAVPEQYPNVVVVPYDARSGYVTSIPRRLV